MLSDEEREAIEHLTEKMKYHKDNPLGTYVWLTLDEHYVRIILNLIEKQQKEIEELKDKNKTLKSLQNDTNGLYIEMTERKNYFERELQKVEDKIKAKIEELEKEQEDNRKFLYNAVNNLCFKEIDKISNRISVNMSIRDILQLLLEKE